ncbi:YggS family pyridoxal phosphate-dependent enzyme [Thermoanaerobacterium thermosaccharolyticum]|uniref:Pyridoxal phosphate homeostasis protein n=1 Tax=Thermoanaerobacterium thermosaccharolyticum M0795 TaxID=698948 RepID=L0IKS9_THETR|nr:YggS family pyridoxal phosphate-dependent enzyme [Thermoanaerobacterium thermosaccharolyticum]AGB18821.1 pyridoxal phosphate enzyme, YggS family [Thermoanaerobacterium thermosaccharolyticum M0795]
MDIRLNLEEIKNNIEVHARKVNRNPDDILVMAVTKTVDVERIQEAIDNGITDIGENKVQELIDKYHALKDKVQFHFIGHLQTNKVKYIIDKVKMIHSLDSIHLAQEINKRAHNSNIIMDCLVEVNIGSEESKYGIDPLNIMDFIKSLESFDNIRIRGLMTVAPFMEPEQVRPYFKKMKELFDCAKSINQKNVDFKYLSMGMTNDYTVAVEEGSNIVRIGTGIFGKRLYNMEVK